MKNYSRKSQNLNMIHDFEYIVKYNKESWKSCRRPLMHSLEEQNLV